MTDRVRCKNPSCEHRILPDTAARNDGLCMPCVHAAARREKAAYIQAHRRDVYAFEGITSPVEILKLVHRPRPFDPLINWLPYPTRTDRLYLNLSAEEARCLADHAADLAGTERHEEAEEIGLCLAAFTDTNLDACLRRFVDLGTLWPSLPFHRSPPDVRDALLARLESDIDVLQRNHVLLALAWIGDAVVVEQFAQWVRHPPGWGETLHIAPQDYAREAGWELTSGGQRRNLYFSTCTPLERGANTTDSGIRTTIARTDNCPQCAMPLTNLFELSSNTCDLPELENWRVSVAIACCERCTCAATVFGCVDDSGQAHWSPQNILPAPLPTDTGAYDKLPSNVLRAGPQRPPLFAAHEFLPTTFSQLGGHPTWIQDARYPLCPDCEQTMMFLGQLDHQDMEDGTEGIYYAFICLDCRTTATSYQQS
ncbi:hypothetical protein [Chitinimonas prasina]|uniref:hypothetical protein n=1 Tax=Chitinimonas prasina TaxID=1434937 RepID=UPI0024E09FAA|nr:hypothetical protein [Chitinimonas prasina]